ncbi:hypothetical protein H0H93_000190 [Arthromyces matolae]|nr:hypothetical protein H0H93_000190 [Arthromyces matolae]
MATPTSSATSPSPPMTFIAHTPGPSQASSSSLMDPADKEQRQKAVQKFMARAEISTITRALRTRLSYASYKAAHNIHHVPLRDLEAQSQSQSQPTQFSRTIAAKRRAVNYHNTPATQSPLGASPASNLLRRGGSGSMLPPPTTSSPRTYQSVVNGSAYATSSHGSSSSSKVAIPNQSLYSSILAPPPTKQARTIHNAGDPPIPAPSRPNVSPKARAPKRGSGDLSRSQVKSRKLDHGTSPQSPKSRKTHRPATGKSKNKTHGTDVDAGGDVDMKAAATLTSLLMHHRPSMAGASSPRSSIDGSEPGSANTHSTQARIIATTSPRVIATRSPPAPPPLPVSTAASTSTVTEASRTQTPPPITKGGIENATTPRPGPTDNEAANLMLFLATSPSPARATNKDVKDLQAFRALGGGSSGVLRDKGRVLFTSSPNSEPTEATKLPTLSRGGDASFTSSVSSIGGELGGGNSQEPPPAASSQLLPPPSFSVQKSGTASPPTDKDIRNPSPRPPPCSQGPMEFNFNDFIHGSPSSPSRVTQAPKTNLGLRADVGRKLFEEEQMRHALSGVQNPAKRPDRVLGTGIDLVQM